MCIFWSYTIYSITAVGLNMSAMICIHHMLWAVGPWPSSSLCAVEFVYRFVVCPRCCSGRKEDLESLFDQQMLTSCALGSWPMSVCHLLLLQTQTCKQTLLSLLTPIRLSRQTEGVEYTCRQGMDFESLLITTDQAIQKKSRFISPYAAVEFSSVHRIQWYSNKASFFEVALEAIELGIIYRAIKHKF